MIVLITGASSGFGEEMARKFVRHGNRVIAAARRTERLARLREELGAALLPVTMDVTDKASIAQALTELPEDWQPIDVLINNAGLALGTEPAHLALLDEWETMIATNTKGLVTMTRAILPAMMARNSGLIINLGSVAGTQPPQKSVGRIRYAAIRVADDAYSAISNNVVYYTEFRFGSN